MLGQIYYFSFQFLYLTNCKGITYVCRNVSGTYPIYYLVYMSPYIFAHILDTIMCHYS